MTTDLVVGDALVQSPQSPQSAQQSREAIREQVRQSIEQARAAAAQAREAARAAPAQAGGGSGSGSGIQGVPVPPVPPVPGQSGDQVVVLGDGRTLVVHPDGSIELLGTDGVGGDGPEANIEVPPFPFGPGGPSIPVEAVVISIAFFVMVVLVAVGIPIARAFGRRIDKRSAAAPQIAELGQRLDRIEQAIETVAVEVERISEGQRYSARLMTEMKAQRIPAGESGR